MKKYVTQILKDGEGLLDAETVSQQDIDDFERHIAYCCHERLIHLIVTLAFAMMTIICMVAMMAFVQPGTMLLFAIFTVMTAAYAWHYYFLENSVQRMYIISDKMHKKFLN